MQKVCWLAFGSSNSLHRTILHFMPASSNTAAPYAVSVSLRLFTHAEEPRELSLEGARMMQPDGVRLEDAFPIVLTEGGPPFYGLEVEFSSPQPRSDLSASMCLVELTGSEGACLFRAAPCFSPAQPGFAPALSLAALPAYQDAFHIPSVVIVNNTAAEFSPSFFHLTRRAAGEEPVRTDHRLGTVPSGVTSEFPLSEMVRAHGTAQECSWGIVRSLALYPSNAGPLDGVGIFAVMRDAVTKRVASVVSF